MKLIISLIFSFLFLQSYSQKKPVSFAEIDRRVKTVNASDAATLSKKLTDPYKTDLEKVRSIFKWIAENIAYDVVGAQQAEGTYPGLWERVESSENPYEEYQDLIVQQVLDQRKAVCDGYSRLFKDLCDRAGLKSEQIVGYTRFSVDSIGFIKPDTDHAWNAVFLDNTWRLLDVTWAAGHGNDSVFTKKYNDFYFLTDPISFFNKHYPSDPKWALLPNVPSLYQFFNYPFFHAEFYNYGFFSLYPLTGHIEVSRKNMIVRIELGVTRPVKEIYMFESSGRVGMFDDSITSRSYQEARADSSPGKKYKVENGKLTYTYKILSDKAKKVHIVYNGEYILDYGIKFKD